MQKLVDFLCQTRQVFLMYIYFFNLLFQVYLEMNAHDHDKLTFEHVCELI